MLGYRLCSGVKEVCAVVRQCMRVFCVHPCSGKDLRICWDPAQNLTQHDPKGEDVHLEKKQLSCLLKSYFHYYIVMNYYMC